MATHLAEHARRAALLLLRHGRRLVGLLVRHGRALLARRRGHGVGAACAGGRGTAAARGERGMAVGGV
jgi:hypothetical protein